MRAIGRLVEPAGADEHAVHIEADGAVFALALESDLATPTRVDIVDALGEFDARRVGLVPSTGLSERCVLLAGAGSIGSQVAVLLAQAGVGRFLVLDNDEFTAANVSRHAAGSLHIGRRKVAVVSELLEERCVEASPLDADIQRLSLHDLDAVVERADVIVSSVDSPAAQFLVNEACARTKTPGVFAGAYERACGGEVVVYRPGVTPCLLCAVGFRASTGMTATYKQRRQAYQAADAARLDAEPGLGADIAYLASITAAFTLALLDPAGSRAALLDPAWNFTLWHGGSAPRANFAALFGEAFDMMAARLQRSEPCPVCGWSRNETVTP